MKTLLRCRHPVFVEVFGRKSNLVILIDGPAVEGVVTEVLRILELCENAFVVCENAFVVRFVYSRGLILSNGSDFFIFSQLAISSSLCWSSHS